VLSISRIFRKSQVWYSDFTIGLLLFLIAVVIYIQYTNSLSKENEATLNDMVLDLKSISSQLVLQGYPSDWNSTSVEKIGLTDGNYRLNQTKLSRFYAIDNAQIISKMNTRFNFYFYILDASGNKILVDGKDHAGLEAATASEKVQTTRIVIYNSSIVRMVMYTWQ
jgi:hypothetical protein